MTETFKSKVKIPTFYTDKDQLPLELDIVNLTLLLKSLGFQLNYLDFENPPPDAAQKEKNADTVSIDIKCNKSGLLSKLSFDMVRCNCPVEGGEHDSAFWEVQGTSPKLMKSKSQVRDASSSLLPEMSDSCAVMTKQILSNLLSFHRDNMQSGGQTTVSGVMSNYLSIQSAPQIVISSPTPKTTPPAESPFAKKAPTSAVDRIKQEMFKKSEEESPIKQEKPASEENPGEWIKQVILKSLTGPKSPVKNEMAEDPAAQIDHKADLAVLQKYCDSLNEDHAYSFDGEHSQNEATATSSPKDENDENILNSAAKDFADAFVEKALENDNKRDVNVIQALTVARQKIDSALIFMKFNLIHDASQTSVLTTPQTMVKKQAAIKRSNSNLQSASRRRTIETPVSPGRKLVSPLPKSTVKRGLPLLVRSTTKIDTPRPSKEVAKLTPMKKQIATASPATKKLASNLVLNKPSTTIQRFTAGSKVNSGLARAPISSSLSKLETSKK